VGLSAAAWNDAGRVAAPEHPAPPGAPSSLCPSHHA
jgi:hypothetical protein